jgi:prepilin peptidase CpaA
MDAPIWISLPIVLVGLLAAREDYRSRQIPNLLTFPSLLLGAAFHWLMGGPTSALLALGAALLAGAILLPGWFLGLMGAGDVKLMVALAVWLGSPRTGLYAVLFSLIAGGVISVIVALHRGILIRTLRDAALLAPRMAAGVRATSSPPATSGVRVPKALAFMAGSLFALWWRG